MQPQARFTMRSLALAALVACLMVGAFTLSKSFYYPEIFHLRANGYGFVSAAAALLTLGLLLRMVIGKSHSDEASWFMLVLFGDILFAGGEALQRLSATPTGAVFWSQVSGIGIPLIALGLFLFAASYTKPPETRLGVVTPLLIATVVFVALFYSEGNLIFNNIPAQMHLFPWGFNSAPGPAFILSVIWAFLLALAAVMMLAYFRYHNRNLLLRKQALLYLGAVLLPIFGGTVTDGILPLFNLDIVPPLATLFEVCTSVVIFYGISRYQFFQINPAILAENVLRTMNEAVVITRRDFSVEFINKEAERLLGVAGDKLGTSYIHSLFAPESWPKVHAYVSDGTQIKTELGDVEIMNHDGKRVPVRVFTSRMSEGETFQAYIFVISDITDITESYNKLESDAARIRRLLEEAHILEKQLEEEKAGVEHTVEVRTRELRAAQERLKAADKIKTEFIMLASHNLRTPLTIMAGSLDMLKITRSAKDRGLSLNALEDGMNRLKGFVEDMVTITTLESGDGVVLEPVPVKGIFDPLVAEAKTLAAAKPGVALQLELDNGMAEIRANANWLQVAIRSLLNNAFKFTETGSVALTVASKRDDLVITVTDTGIGIKPDELPKLFTKFHRGTDTLEYAYEGEGIGLYLAKLIVEEHKGAIGVASKLGEGTVVTVTIPLAKATKV